MFLTRRIPSIIRRNWRVAFTGLDASVFYSYEILAPSLPIYIVLMIAFATLTILFLYDKIATSELSRMTLGDLFAEAAVESSDLYLTALSF